MIKTTGLKEEMAKIASLGKVFDEELIKELDDLGLEWRDDVRKNTPVSESVTYVTKGGRVVSHTGGDLRKSTVFEGTVKSGKTFVLDVTNNLDYAEHYEYGHRQEVGRYVPAIGKRLVSPYVRGRYTFRKGRQRAKGKVPAAIRKAIRRAEERLSD